MFLPKPPTFKELELYKDPNKAFLYSFGIVSTGLLITGGFLFATQRPWLGFWWFSAFVALNAFYLGISYLVGLSAKPFDITKHWDIVRDSGDFMPSVDVYLPTCGEPLEILANTYKHVKDLMWWPNLRVYVLDDAARIEVCTMAMEHGFTYWSRPNRGELKKSGNVRSLFPQTSGELILILDADFVPRYDMLKNMVPYFRNNKIAILQTPQFFEVDQSMNWLQRGASSIQELFYRLIQVNRDSFNACICVGTNALYRRKALEPLGGTFPIQHSEDLHTGFWVTINGWLVKYIPVNLAAGLCPDTVDSFLKQQHRWCLGSFSLFLNRRLFWGSRLTIMQRLSYLSGMLFYLATGLSVIFNGLPSMLMAWLYPEHIFWTNFIWAFPSMLFGVFLMRAWNKAPYGLAAIQARILSYVAYLFAIKEKIFGGIMPWEATGGASSGLVARKTAQMKLFLFFISTIWYGLTMAGVIKNIGSPWNYDFYPVVFISSFWWLITIGALRDEVKGIFWQKR